MSVTPEQRRQDNYARAGFGMLGAVSVIGGLVTGKFAAGLGIFFLLVAFAPSETLRKQLRLFGWSIPPLGLFVVVVGLLLAGTLAALL